MKLRKISALIISVLMILSSLPLTSFAKADGEEIIYTEMKTPMLYSSSGVASASFEELSQAVDISALKAYIIEALKTVPSSIDISQFNITYSLKDQISELIWYNIPEAFSVYGIGFSYMGDKLLTIALGHREFADTESEYTKCLEEFISVSERLLLGVKGNDALSEAEKALLLHDRLSMLIEYDYTSEGDIKHTAYGAFAKKAAVCQGYTMAYMYLLNEVGIESYYCSSENMNHAWNILYIDGKPYHTDVTWDDTSWQKKGRGIVGAVSHDNFLRSTEGIIATEHDGGDFDTGPSDTKYDNYYWQSSDTQFCLVDNELYYIDNVNSRLMKAGSDEALSELSGIWLAGGNGYFTDKFFRLSQSGNELLYSTNNKIYKYNTITGSTREILAPSLAAGFSVFGFIYEDGYLVLDINDTINNNENLYQIKEACSFVCEHSFEETADEKYLISSAHCSSAALYYKSCSLCGSTSDESFYYGEADSTVHNAVRTVPAVPESCIHSGYTEGAYCDNCEKYISGHEEIPATDHPDRYDTDEIKPTCINTGFTAGVYCPDCEIYISGHEVTETDENKHINTKTVIETAPTCTEAGFTEGIFCNDCEKYVSGHEKIPATEHPDKYDTDEVKANCIKTGFTAGVYCPDCEIYLSGHEITEIDSDNHTNTESIDAVEADCVNVGYTDGVYCHDCKTYISGHTELPVDSEKHNNTRGTEEEKASCIKTGFTAGVYCDDCEKYISGHTVIEINADNHINKRDVAEKAATCTEKGFTAGIYCDDCEKYISGHTVIEINADNHINKRDVEGKIATCTEKGFTAGVYCNDCKTYVSGHSVIAVNGKNHKNTQKTEAAEATCIKTGFTEGVYCNDCKAYVSGHSVIAVNGNNHKNTQKTEAAEATCIKTGFTEGVYCNDCKTYVSGHSVTAVNGKNHKNTQKTEAVDSTTENVGYTEGIYCNDCKKYISGHEEIEKKAEFVDTETAKNDGKNIVMTTGITAAQLLTQATKGAVIKTAEGDTLKEDEAPGTGMTLVLPDGKEEVIVVFGDVDGDAGLSAADARLALRTAVGLEGFTPDSPYYKAAAVSGEKEVSAADARLILRASVGLDDPKSWMDE